MNVGTDGNTAALAVESVRRWWQRAGRAAYPGASRLLLTCDAGGSNAAVSRGWKAGLAELARETGLDGPPWPYMTGTGWRCMRLISPPKMLGKAAARQARR